MKLERHAGRAEVRRRRADVMEKAGKEVGLGAGREVGEMLRDDCRAIIEHAHGVVEGLLRQLCFSILIHFLRDRG